ncbi:uncharacterized protein LOC109857909 isoform X2 [Pseudomyrmex gracilis]|uniref:uncharacterized protein LOC109857909 isoform X2 n=1 Tax=Pseudomyrmex gracilis TaxID=219809 RepID=UPI000994EE13|nr:uncharacterized protein LOC109857909 isoform X2 [Pseudomyrmex gracilis]
MSQNSEMGLFGSKDSNREQKEKSSKDNSPAQYAPYGSDSDTETYDTEALSMMDINDIIGVQSGEQVGDSTLESEIAALTQIITETKDLTSQLRDPSTETKQISSTASSSISDSVSIENIEKTSITDVDDSSVKTSADNIQEMQTESTSDHTDKNVTCEDKTSNISNNGILDDTSIVCTSESSSKDCKSNTETTSVTVKSDISQEVSQSQLQKDAIKHERDIEEKTQSFEETEIQNESTNSTQPMITVSSISKSLQLIGEAYNSEDSEETDINDNDSHVSKDTPSISVSEESSLFSISKKLQDEENNSKESNLLGETTKSSETTEDVNIGEESNVKVENFADSKLVSSSVKVKEIEESNQNEMLKQEEEQESVLKEEENKDTPVLNKVIEESIDDEKTSICEEDKNTEIDKTDTAVKKSVQEHQTFIKSKETADMSVSSASSEEIIKNTEESQDIKTENVSELNVLTTPETEQSNSSSENKLPDKKRKLTDDDSLAEDNIKELIQYTPECKDRDTVLESANKQDFISSDTSDKKVNMSEMISKSDHSEEANGASKTSQTTQKISLEHDKTSDRKETNDTSANSDNVNLSSIKEKKKLTLMDESVVLTTSDTTNKVVLKENTSLSHPKKEISETTSEQSASDHLEEVNLHVHSDLATQSDVKSPVPTDKESISIDVNSIKTATSTEENVLTEAVEKLVQIVEDESVSSVSEKAEVIKNPVSYELEESCPVPSLNQDSNNTTENINKPSHETEEIQEIKLPVEVLTLNIDQDKIQPTENKAEEPFNQSESEKDVKSKEVDSGAMQLEEGVVESTARNLEEDKIKENVTEMSSDETEIKESKTLASSLEEEKKPQEEEKIKKSDEDIEEKENDEAKLKLRDKSTKILERGLGESVESSDATPIIEEKNMESIIEESSNVDLKDVNSSIANIIDISLLQEDLNERVDSEKLTEGLSQDAVDMDTENVAPTIDSLEGLLGSFIPNNENSLKDMKSEDKIPIEETVSKDVDMDILLGQADQSDATITQDSSYITDVIADCLSRNDEINEGDVNIPVNDKITENEDSELLKMNEDMSAESVNEAAEKMEEPLITNSGLQQNDLDIDFENNQLESVEELEESETKLELPQDILEGVMPRSNRENTDTPTVIENSQSSSEISELESAVKFLQESEEQIMDSPLVLSPKMVDSVVDDITKQANADLYASDETDNYANVESELADLRDVSAADSISISEAEIISEAAKLESERKFAEQMQNASDTDTEEKMPEEINEELNEDTENCTSKTSSEIAPIDNSLNVQAAEQLQEKKPIPDIRLLSSESILKTELLLPRTSILEERLREPPKIEIPDSAKVLESSISPNDSLLIPKDAKAMARMLESPKSIDKIELKTTDTPRKDSEKYSEFENVGSPRIILKIAKSAITDCSEPRSPKSPKIRSATNSPNPEDSPGQKLGKIKLKLSKGGHPSIISNENVEETSQWHTTDSSSVSPLGMKIKLSKSGDASIVSTEKHDNSEDSKETKYKIEEPKRTDSPIGMKIKLSKSGDASIISDSRQQDSKEAFAKHKEKLEIPQGSPKRTESPIGMKIKLSKTGDASIIQNDRQDHPSEEHKETAPKRTDSPIGMKIKLSKTGDASIVSPDISEDTKDSSSKKEKQDYSEPKRTESPIGMKIKLCKNKGSASIISVDNIEDTREKIEASDSSKRTESPLGMKIKLSKTGDASIIHSEVTDDVKETRYKEKSEITEDREKTPDFSGIKIKMPKAVVTSTSSDAYEEQDVPQVPESSLTNILKIKVSKSGDASVISDKTESASEDSKSREDQTEAPQRTESPLGMKIKLSKSGDASIIQNEAVTEDQNKTMRVSDVEYSKSGDSSIGMKIKLLKTGDASVVETPSSTSSCERKDKQQKRRDAADSPLEMKIKLSKTGHPTIVTCDSHESSIHKKDSATVDPALNFPHRYMDHVAVHKEPPLKILKTGHHSSLLQSNRSEVTIEPVQIQNKKQQTESVQQQLELKRKDMTISPVESKKSKLEQLSQILPEVTIQPVLCREQKQQEQQQQLLFDPKTSLISRQQMNVINQEISITQVRPTTASPSDTPSVSDKLKDILGKTTNSPGGSSDCEIIEHRPELIIVNENSNSSQDVVIIEEVTPQNKVTDIKVPKKRGRPRRNPQQQLHAQMLLARDPLALDAQQVPPQPLEHRENERPKRTCRNQKSYAPPKRGRGGRGRGKRKLDNVQPHIGKKSRIEQDLSAIEASTMAVITIDTPVQQEPLDKSSELYKALKQPPIDRKSMNPVCKIEKHVLLTNRKETGKKDVSCKVADSDIAQLDPDRSPSAQEDQSKMSANQINPLGSKITDKKSVVEIVSEKTQKTTAKQYAENKNKVSDGSGRGSEIKEIPVPPGHSNWLTPTSTKKQADATIRGETVSTVQVIDEETRMSAESGSRSQTPARNIPAPASETTINEESQGSVLSTATTESEKVKVKNRRMEINFDPDEGPFTVDKIAEYEWPLDRKGETFMIQEQISQYLGVKSFKRKYPDLKRRVVDMEERNYLRENGLVSESMCDMGLTAVCSSEVLDIMCSDFPDQYEEYRKHMREKQVKEHSKKQKELTAAANAERNRIDLAEMAVQSALSWNMSLNKARRENRKCCLDLQTFTIHVPKKQQKVDPEHKVGHYPVALIPGQYTDYYREYTPAELRYYPLNTVLYGPTRPNERKFDSQSEGSQSDSDSESSSDDSSSSSSEGTQDTEESQSTMDDVDMEISNSKDNVKFKCKMCLKVLNKHNMSEILIQCGTCNGNVHPSCIDLTLDMVPHIQSYAWQCTDCKTCAQCHDPADEDKMLFCDMCDRGYHIYCVGLRRVPQGRWHCQECAVCANCGSREPGGANSDRNSVAQWQHEYKKGEKNTRVYVSTLCVPCSKLWRKGRYCPHCSRCHTAQRLDLEVNLVHCSACDKYLHLECVETKGVVIDKKNYQCDFCTPSSRHQMTKSLVSRMLKT